MSRRLVPALLACALACGASPMVAQEPDSARAALLAARDAVWRHYFAHPDSLRRTLTADFIAIDNGGGPWRSRDDVIEGSRRAVANGLRLADLVFPETRVQRYGDVAVVYTSFAMTLADSGGVRPPLRGRGTEVFRWDGGRWLHTGWHLDSGR